MRDEFGLFTRRVAALLGAAALLVPASVAAQGGGEGFLFKRPSVSIMLRTGYEVRRAESDLFDTTRATYRGIGRRDFDGASFGGEIAVRASDRVDVVLGLAHARSEVFSEYEHFLGTDSLPINQQTRFWTTPLTLSGRYYLADRGRTIGRFAWVPTRITPYVGAGLGVVWYGFEQEGEFINFDTFDIYDGFLQEEGHSFGAHAMAGLDVGVTNNLVLNVEGRLNAARGAVNGFAYGDLADEVDLSGLQITLGLGLRF